MLALLVLTALWQVPAAATPPADPATLFNEGITFDAFMQDVQSQRKTWEANAARAKAPQFLVDRLKRAGDGLKLLAISEAACSDSVQTIPYVARLAQQAGVDLRLIGKPKGMPLLDGHRSPDGRTATPTIILIRDGKDVGAFIERPEVLQSWFLANLDLTTRERLERKTAWYEWDRGTSTMTAIVELAERTAMPDGRR